MEKHCVCPAEKSGMLNGKIRKVVQNPKRILKKYVKPGMKVLDFGCGPGMFSIAMVELGAQVIAADLQQEMLNILKNNVSKTKFEKNIKLIKCEENQINVNEKIDFLLAFYVLHEVKNKKNFFKQAKDILKKNSKLYIAEPTFHVSRNEFEEELELAEKQGFKTIQRPKYWLSRTAVLEKQ